MPNIHSLGFHFSTWENVTADTLVYRNRNFTQRGFPVDYLWMDLDYTDDGVYFDFSPWKFPEDQKFLMEQEVVSAGRRLVIIADPHIKLSHVKADFKQKGALSDSQIFVQTHAFEAFQAECWPGTSLWVDFFSESGRKMWAD